MGRNLEWPDSLACTLLGYESGKNYTTSALALDDPVPQVTNARKKAKPKTSVPQASKKRKADQIQESDEYESEDDAIMQTRAKRTRVRDNSAVDTKYAELLAETHDFDDKDTEKWIKSEYKLQARSLAFTGRKQTLWLLASLLAD